MTRNKAIKQAKILAHKTGITHVVYFDDNYQTFKVCQEWKCYEGIINANNIVAAIDNEIINNPIYR